jgi:hypothetical protein
MIAELDRHREKPDKWQQIVREHLLDSGIMSLAGHVVPWWPSRCSKQGEFCSLLRQPPLKDFFKIWIVS